MPHNFYPFLHIINELYKGVFEEEHFCCGFQQAVLMKITRVMSLDGNHFLFKNLLYQSGGFGDYCQFVSREYSLFLKNTLFCNLRNHFFFYEKEFNKENNSLVFIIELQNSSYGWRDKLTTTVGIAEAILGIASVNSCESFGAEWQYKSSV